MDKNNLWDVLRVGYSNDKEQQKNTLEKTGYIRDNDLSNENHQVYYNKEKKDLLYNINGTQNNLAHFLQDWKTNLQIGLGYGTKTQRYNEEKDNLQKAKNRYDENTTTITGSSQGGYMASHIADKNDKVFTYNKASIGEPVGNNETHYRSGLDIVSLPNAFSKHTKNINFNPFQSILQNHSIDNLKDKNILIDNNIKNKNIFI